MSPKAGPGSGCVAAAASVDMLLDANENRVIGAPRQASSIQEVEFLRCQGLAIRHLGATYGYPVLDPVAWSQAVSRYSMATGLWKHVADALLAREPLSVKS